MKYFAIFDKIFPISSCNILYYVGDVSLTDKIFIVFFSKKNKHKKPNLKRRKWISNERGITVMQLISKFGFLYIILKGLKFKKLHQN